MGTSKIKKVHNNDNDIHCSYGKQCIYYQKFMELKKEIDSIINTYNKLNLFNKSIFASLQQKSKDCQYLMKENVY